MTRTVFDSWKCLDQYLLREANIKYALSYFIKNVEQRQAKLLG